MYVEEVRLKKHVNITNVTNVNPMNCQEILREILDGTVPAIVLRTSPDLLHVCYSTAAIMTSSLAGVRTDRERPAFSSTIGITHPVLRRCCFKRRNTLGSDLHWPEKCRSDCRVSVPARILQPSSVKRMLQNSWYVYSTVIW
jgi:hypothetical protein